MITFGRECYTWQERLQAEGQSLQSIYDELKIPRSTAGRWVDLYLEDAGLKPPRPDRAKTNADIVLALTRRIFSVKKAVEKMAKDWKGWAETCPTEVHELKAAIREAGDCFRETA